jgi:hypothetical protein
VGLSPEYEKTKKTKKKQFYFYFYFYLFLFIFICLSLLGAGSPAALRGVACEEKIQIKNKNCFFFSLIGNLEERREAACAQQAAKIIFF